MAAKRRGGKRIMVSCDFWVRAAVLILAIAAILVVIYIISLFSSATSLIILAVFMVSAAVAVWYNYITAGTIRG